MLLILSFKDYPERAGEGKCGGEEDEEEDFDVLKDFKDHLHKMSRVSDASEK